VTDSIALYIHLPFCKKKCGYCSFVSFEGRESNIPEYISALDAELTQRANGECISSIFFGGGTPSLLASDQLDRILTSIRTLFKVTENAEISLEANPGTVDERYFKDIRQLGINRLSLGVQSLNEQTLSFLGRIHTAGDARRSVRFAREAGFSNLNLDLIYGIPGQSLTTWIDTLKEAVRLSPEHFSLYPLTLEDDVPLNRAIKRGELSDIDPDCAADQYEAAEDYLASRGYCHYEISNWAREGMECRHNKVYWQCLPYLGIGVAAHSYIDGHRIANTTDLNEYLGRFQRGEPFLFKMDEEITLETQLAEAIIMGLRLTAGIEFGSMKKRFGIELPNRYEREISELVQLGLIETDERGIRLTSKGLLLGNEVFWRFLTQ